MGRVGLAIYYSLLSDVKSSRPDKFCGLGLIGFGLGLVLGLVKHWSLSHVSNWPRGLNNILCDTLNEK